MKKTILSIICGISICLCFACASSQMAQEATEGTTGDITAPVPAGQPSLQDAESSNSPAAEQNTASEQESSGGSLTYGGDKFIGMFEDSFSERAYLTVIPTDHFGVYDVSIHWSDSADTFDAWEMTASYDEPSDSIRYTDGKHTFVTLQENGPEKTELMWDHSVGSFHFDGDVLLWEDDREESARDMRLSQSITPAPTAAELVNFYLKPIASLSGDTHADMLKQAKVAYEILKFASDNAIWCNSHEELTANLKEAWAQLDASQQDDFSDELFAVQGLIVNSTVDWENFGYLFTESGIGEEMQALEHDMTAIESFYRLFDNTVAAVLN